jgi:hypothetical protein
MGLRKRLKKKAKNFFKNPLKFTADKVKGDFSHVKKGLDSASEWGQRAKDQYTEGYRRYKDPIIIGGATALGAVLGTLLAPGLGTVGGAALGASLAGGTASTARSLYVQQKAAKEAENLYAGDDNLFASAARRVRGRSRHGGEGDIQYSTYEDAGVA